jgi:hypothetical protein
MKRLSAVCLFAFLCLAIAGFAQAPAPAAQGQPAPQPPATLAAAVDRQISQYEKLMVDAAEAMPEAKFDFNPESLAIKGSEFKTVRTFAVLIKHTATANYRYWSGVSGDKFPESIKDSNGPAELKTKAEIIQFLKDSFAVGHRAAKTLTAENALEMISMGRGSQPRLSLLTGAVIHCGDEYGQMVEYLRMSGVVPPASAPR